MKNNKQISLSEQVADLELANQTLRNYAQGLEEKLAVCERLLQHCPKFRSAQSAGSLPPAIGWLEPHPIDPYDDFYDHPDDDFEDDIYEDDDWDGLEESDFIDDWEEEY